MSAAAFEPRILDRLRDEVEVRRITESLQGQADARQEASAAVDQKGLKPAVYQGDFEAAARAAQALIGLESKQALGFQALGVVRWHQGDLKGCVENLRKAY